jgi:hypothetical protein
MPTRRGALVFVLCCCRVGSRLEPMVETLLSGGKLVRVCTSTRSTPIARLTISQQPASCCWLSVSCTRVHVVTTVPNGAVLIQQLFCGAFHGPVGPHPPSPPPRAGSSASAAP